MIEEIGGISLNLIDYVNQTGKAKVEVSLYIYI